MHPPVQTDSPAAIRRPAYGPNPMLGRHGLRARQEILDAARRLFAEQGYHATTVESIGVAAGRSGASVYQYFEGKGDLFRVFVDEATDEVLAEAVRLGELRRQHPGPPDRTEIQYRIAALSAVLTRHAATFALWPVVEGCEDALRGSAGRFVRTFAECVRPLLDAAGVPAERQLPLAIAIGSMVQSSHSTRAARAPSVAASTLDEVLARVVYAALVPAGEPAADRPGRPVVPARLPRPVGAQAIDRCGTVPGVRRRITERGRGTLDRILASAAVAFRRNGFVGTRLKEVAQCAGVSHGSLYTYWPDRSALFETLAHQAAVTLSDHIEAAPDAFADTVAGHAWLGRWLEVVEAHGAVLNIWTHEVVDDERLGPLAREMQRYVGAFLASVVRSAPTAELLDRGAANVVMWTLLTDVPYTHCYQLRIVSHEDLHDALATLLMRGLLGHR